MNTVQVHLALTHVPVILSLVGLVGLILSSIMKNSTLTKSAYVLLLVAGVAAIPVFFSGAGTEEAIEHLPGVSEAIIERHEEVAKLAMISIAAAGLVSLAAIFSFKWLAAARLFKMAVLVLALASGGLMTQTAHLGGQIRHTEIRNGSTGQNANDAGNDNEGSGNQQQVKDDD